MEKRREFVKPLSPKGELRIEIFYIFSWILFDGILKDDVEDKMFGFVLKYRPSLRRGIRG